MAAFLREFLYLVILYKFHPVVSHIGTKENFIADHLSRYYSEEAAKAFFQSLGMENMILEEVPDFMFKFSSEW